MALPYRIIFIALVLSIAKKSTSTIAPRGQRSTPFSQILVGKKLLTADVEKIRTLTGVRDRQGGTVCWQNSSTNFFGIFQRKPEERISQPVTSSQGNSILRHNKIQNIDNQILH